MAEKRARHKKRATQHEQNAVRRSQFVFENYLDSIDNNAVSEDIIRDIEFDILADVDHVPHVENSAQVPAALGELSKQLLASKHETPYIKNDQAHSVLDMDGYQFSVRMNNALYTLKPIRTRLNWQTGEFPIFRSEARHFSASTVPFKERRRMMRKPQISSIIDPSRAEYFDYEHPEDEWPIKGQLYITNMQVLFRVNRHNIIPIPFNMIYNYYFYRNAVEVVYLKRKEKKTDILFMDQDNMRLAEILLQSLG